MLRFVRLLLPLVLVLLAGCPPTVNEELQLTSDTLELGVGEARQVTARVFAGSVPGEATGASWASSNRDVVTVSSVGDGTATLQGLTEGTPTITARLRSLTATLQVTVTRRIVRLSLIELAPVGAMVAKGLTLQLVATGHFTDGTTSDVTSSVTWSSSNPSLATVSASGLLTALESGPVQVTATRDQEEARLTVMVTNARITSIALTPVNPTLARGTRTPLTATATLTDSTTQDVTAQVVWLSSDASVASVSGSGVVTAVSLGDATISASVLNVTGTTRVTVTDGALTQLAVTPPTSSVPRGLSVDLTATGTFSDATTQDLSMQVNWSSSAPAIADVNANGVVTALNLGTCTITAELNGITATANITVSAATLQTIQVDPPSASLAVGTQRNFIATGIYSDTSTQDLTSQLIWLSSDNQIAQVGNSTPTKGRVFALAPGAVTIWASRGSIVGQAQVSVTAASLVSLSVTPANPSLAKGVSQQFTARGTFSDLSAQDVTNQVTWSTDTPSVAAISNASGSEGELSSRGVGSSTVIATLNGVTGQTNVTVTPAVMVRVDVTPTTVMLPKGRTQQLTATGVFSDATTTDLTSQAMWSSATPFVATVSPSGLLTGVNVGNATISASFMSFTGQRPISVTAAAVESITITPASLSLAKGRTQQLTASATFSDTSVMDVTTQVTWLSTAPGLLDISNAGGTEGLATALALGSGQVSATLQGVTGNASFTVGPAELISLSIAPMLISVPRGRSQQFTATGTFSDATMTDLTTSVTWSSTVPATATISSTGLAATLAVGSTSIQASSGAVTSNATLDVIPPVLDHIDVTPVNPSRAKGLTQQLTATGVLTDGMQQDLTSTAMWSSSNATTVSISATGLSTALLVGSSNVTATLGGITGGTTFTVTPAQLMSISVSPPAPTLPKGRTQAFTAQGTFTDSSVQDLTATATWASSNGTAVSITAGGVASALAVGTSSISATQSSVVGNSTFTVTPAVVDSIVLSGRVFTAVGASTRLTATGTFSDATVADVTALATWSSDLPAIARANDVLGVRGVVSGIAAGAANITATVGSANASVSVSVKAVNAPYTGRCATGLVMSQLFGGGGNSGAPFRNDYVELHNAGLAPRSLNGMSLQYTSDTGTAWASNLRALPNVTIEPGGYFLIQLNTNGTIGAQITADHVLPSQLNISATQGKLALVSNATGMPVNVCPDGTVTVDFIGFGATANCSEGSPAPGPSNTTALFRGVTGCRDANTNATDLAVGAPNPRSSTTPPVLCSCAVNETDLSEEEQFCNLQFPSSMSRTAGTLSDTLFSRVFHAGLTEPPGSDPSIVVEFGFGPSGANPLVSSNWLWWPSSFNVQVLNDDEYQGAFVVPAAGAYDFTSRESRDGVNWTYCDSNGAGTNAGLTFEPTMLGTLTSTP